jgi:signal transduction histidine kinase
VTSHDVLDLAVIAALGLALLLLARRITRVRRDLSHQMARLEKLNDISRVLLTDRNIRGVLRHVAENAAELLAADMAHVTLVTADPQRLVLEAATGPLTPLIGSAVPLEGSMAGWVVTHAQQLVLNDPEADGRGFRSVHERIPLRRAAVLPVIAKGRCVGALGVDNPRNGRPFEPADIETLRELSNYAALVIESLQAVEELAQRERRAGLINAVNSRIRQSLDLQVMLDAAARELGTALDVSRCIIRLRRGGELGGIAAEWQAAEVPHLSSRADPSQPLLLAAMRERRTIETSDLRTMTPASDQVQPLGVLAAPIVLRGEAIGVIAFHQVGYARLWRPGEVGLVEEVAADLAIAISNARLYRSVEDASRELATKISELERANRMKAQFLANMSHELRTPLNSVIGFSEMLSLGALGSLSPEQRDALETIARNGRHLLQLVNDVLDLSKVDAGRMDLNLVRTDVRRLIPDVLAGMESLVSAKGHTVTLDLGNHALAITADEMRVRQVLFNLLSNAVKFTPAGGSITVKAERIETRLPIRGDLPAERPAVRVSIEDTGIGIAADDIPRLFSEFTQVDASYSRRFEGTGLGLALCKKFIELHGGQIGVKSEPGEGSTFWIELPVDGPLVAAA